MNRYTGDWRLTLRRLASDVGVDERHVKRAVKMLVDVGLVAIRREKDDPRYGTRPSTYVLLPVAVAKAPPRGADSAPPRGADSAPPRGADSAPPFTFKGSTRSDPKPPLPPASGGSSGPVRRLTRAERQEAQAAAALAQLDSPEYRAGLVTLYQEENRDLFDLVPELLGDDRARDEWIDRELRQQRAAILARSR